VGITLSPPIIKPWLIITNEGKNNKTSVSVHHGALVTKWSEKINLHGHPLWIVQDLEMLRKNIGKTSRKLPEELPCGESLGINGVREKSNVFHGSERYVKNSGVVCYCVDL